MRKFLQNLSLKFPSGDHVGCKDPVCLNKHDVDDWMKLELGAESCCGYCGCCNCCSWRCGHCFWNIKLKKLSRWIWND